jgi:hypothetical protein
MVHNFFSLYLAILTAPLGLLFKNRNKRLRNAIMLSELTKRNVERSYLVNDGNASGSLVYDQEFSRNSQYYLTFKTVFWEKYKTTQTKRVCSSLVN